VRNLVGYLSDFAQAYLRPTTVRCRLDIGDELTDRPVTAAVRHNLLLAFKEALNNAVKHSRATEVWVRIQTPPGMLRVVIEDNGQGFEPAKIAVGGNGLSNFRDRLAAAGGVAEIDSAPGGGTRVGFILPLPG
jgi:signal transduction histidine kinase